MKYKITFNTGSQSGAGTDADVSIKLFGSKLSSKEITLNSKFAQFEKGKSDCFFLKTEDLGNLEKIQIWHNNKLIAPNWFLNNVIIEAEKKSWFFPINKWITKNKKVTTTAKKCAKYNFEISTGTLPGSGSKDNIQISIVSSKAYTHFFDITHLTKNKEFITGHTEYFDVIQEDIGKIEEIKIRSTEQNLGSNWFAHKIKVKKESEDKFHSFPIHKWLKEKTVLSSTKNLVEYTIKFYTGDVASGGTDANVSMIIYGTRGETKPIKFNELIARNAFESGKVDYVKLAHKNLGSIKKIKIWHDKKWIADGWFLNKIIIKNENTGVDYKFPYYSWLDKSTDPKSTNIELTKDEIEPRPFYVIAHMVNTPTYVEEALNLGSNAIECDITPVLGKDGNYSFEVFHGFRPDFDPDKINLMERSIARTELSPFLKNLKEFEEKYKSFSLVIWDCKVTEIPQNKLEQCGMQFAEKIINEFYGNDDIGRIYTIFSIAKKKSIKFIDGVMKIIPKDLLPFIGYDLTMENFKITEKLFKNRKSENFWWGHGIASTVPIPLQHFLPQILIAAKKRTKYGIVKKIYYWTLDDTDSMEKMLVTKLDGIIVNDPLLLLKILEKEEFKYSYRLANKYDNPFSLI